MSNAYSSPTCDDPDYPPITQSDLNRAKFRVNRQAAPRKQRVIIMLDTGLIEYFKAQAGDRGYQTMINEALRQVVERETLRRVVREELEEHPPAADRAVVP